MCVCISRVCQACLVLEDIVRRVAQLLQDTLQLALSRSILCACNRLDLSWRAANEYTSLVAALWERLLDDLRGDVSGFT